MGGGGPRWRCESGGGQLDEWGLEGARGEGATRQVMGGVGAGRGHPGLSGVREGVHEVWRISGPYKLASRSFQRENTVITIGDVRIGGDEVVVMAGPCSAESPEQVEATAVAVKRAGAKGVSYTHLRAHETAIDLVCRLLLEKKKKT